MGKGHTSRNICDIQSDDSVPDMWATQWRPSSCNLLAATSLLSTPCISVRLPLSQLLLPALHAAISAHLASQPFHSLLTPSLRQPHRLPPIPRPADPRARTPRPLHRPPGLLPPRLRPPPHRLRPLRRRHLRHPHHRIRPPAPGRRLPRLLLLDPRPRHGRPGPAVCL
jgi:hypothetical protein